MGYDYNTTSFFEYLGIQYLSDGEENEVANIKGGCMNCAEDLKFDYKGGVSPHLSVDHLESDGGELLFTSEDGIGRVFINEESSYKVISSSVVMAAMANADSLNLKPYLFSEFVNYFLGYNPITTLKENLSQNLEGNNHPNPFTSETTIYFDINQAGPVQIEIYSINGQLIRNLVQREFKPGHYNVTWDATDQSGNKVDNGYYLYRIISGQNVITRKMVFLK